MSIWLSPRSFSASLLFRQRSFYPAWEKKEAPRVSPFIGNHLSLNHSICINEEFECVACLLKFSMANPQGGQSNPVHHFGANTSVVGCSVTAASPISLLPMAAPVLLKGLSSLLHPPPPRGLHEFFSHLSSDCSCQDHQ